MNSKLIAGIKIVLAVLFVLCLFHMPYGFFNLVRFLALLGFALLAFGEGKAGNYVMMIVFVALALLFQPFVKVALGRTIWNMVDVITALMLIVSIFVRRKV